MISRDEENQSKNPQSNSLKKIEDQAQAAIDRVQANRIIVKGMQQ